MSIDEIKPPTDPNDPVSQVIEQLKNIDTSKLTAELNSSSIEDVDNKRIEL